ncbi:uncharacterized protein [Trachinotus anak]|uniref:uncharacterized protein n=1 Tax=Trachinotus anak TaxID=443729 RepID=UPI0039F23F53
MEVGVLSGSDIEFYVWDHVAIALHVEEGQVLHFDDDKLRENLTFCDPGQASYHQNFDSYEEADEVVCERAWPCYPAPLERERSLQESLAALQSSCSDVSRQPIGRHMAESSPSSTLIIGDSIMASVRMRGAHTLSFPEATVLDIIDKLPDIIRSHPEADRVVIHAGTNEDQ